MPIDSRRAVSEVCAAADHVMKRTAGKPGTGRVRFGLGDAQPKFGDPAHTTALLQTNDAGSQPAITNA